MAEVPLRGPFLQGFAKAADHALEGIVSDRHGEALQPGGQAHQQFRPLRQEDRVDDGGRLGDILKRPCARRASTQSSRK